jgi:hypothetical protein
MSPPSLSHPCKAVFLLCLLTGFLLQWELSQGLAWIQMIREYSQESSLATAVEDTFSGQKPCSMCVSLTREKTQNTPEDRITVPSPGFPYFLCPVGEPMVFPSATSRSYFSDAPGLRAHVPTRPPVPPPRFFSC